MDYYPLFADLRGQPCLVVGGGPVAARKARELAAAGAHLTVNAPDIGAGVESLAADGLARIERRGFDPGLVAGHLLVIAATGDPAVNRAVAAAARAAQRFCNVVDDGEASSFIVPAVVDRAPVIVAVSSGGRAPLLARRLRQRLEVELPARLGELARWAGGWRARLKRALPTLAARRAAWENLLEGPAAAAVLRGDEAAADRIAAALLAGGGRPGRGCAWIVGAGPGDPGLISVRGLRCLEQADVVMHDRLVAPELLRSARTEAEIINVGKTGGAISTSQAAINELLVSRVRAGARVCRLKGGDPLIFGRGAEEALALAAAGLDFEIVPGISAASGCGAAAGIPLTHRGLAAAVTLVTARGAADGGSGPDWPALAALGGTLAIYMGGDSLEEVAGALTRHGRDPATPVAVIRDGTRPGQQVLTGTLATLATLATPRGLASTPRGAAPALVIVGETAALAALIGPGRHPQAAATVDTYPARAAGR